MKRLLQAILGVYALATIATKLAEQAGVVGCPCPDECWYRRPEFTAFRYLAPVDDTPVEA